MKGGGEDIIILQDTGAWLGWVQKGFQIFKSVASPGYG